MSLVFEPMTNFYIPLYFVRFNDVKIIASIFVKIATVDLRRLLCANCEELSVRVVVYHSLDLVIARLLAGPPG